MILVAILALAPSSIAIHRARDQDVSAGPQPVIALRRTIPVPAAEGRFDHLALDLARRRLYVTEVEKSFLHVLDLENGAPFALDRPIAAFEPHGVLFVRESDVVLVTNAGWSTLDVFDADSFARKARVSVGDDADNVRYEPATRLTYVGFGEGERGALGVVDSRTWKLVATIPVGGHPESFQFDAKASRAFVNVPSLRAVVVVDLGLRKVVDTWRLEGAEANYPMAIQGADRRLFVGCRRPPKLLVLDPSDGRAFESLPLAGDADDIFLDEASGRVFVSCGEGAIDVFERNDVGRYRAAGSVPTAPGARTCQFSPGEEKLYLAVPRRGEQSAEIRVYDTRP